MKTIIATPELFVHGLINPESNSMKMLQLWKNEDIRLSISSQLLILYIRSLKKSGISDDQLKRWALWFTSGVYCDYSKSLVIEAKNPASICQELLEKTSAEIIVHSDNFQLNEEITGEKWMKASQFLNEFSK